MDTFENFLHSGQLPKLSAGMSSEQVEQALGPPIDTSVNKRPLIWVYGPLQLTFMRGKNDTCYRLTFLALYFTPGSLPPMHLDWLGWWPQGASIDQIRHYMTERSIAFADVDALDHMDLPSGVKLLFDEGTLRSAQFSAPRVDLSKQVSLTLPADIWEHVKKHAAERQLSPGKFCADIVAGVMKKTPSRSERNGD
jgi:hypothetical protein